MARPTVLATQKLACNVRRVMNAGHSVISRSTEVHRLSKARSNNMASTRYGLQRIGNGFSQLFWSPPTHCLLVLLPVIPSSENS